MRVSVNVPLAIEQLEAALGFKMKVPAAVFASDCMAPVNFRVVAIAPFEFKGALSWRFEIASPPGRLTWPLRVAPTTALLEKQLDCWTTVLIVPLKALSFCFKKRIRMAC